MKTQPRGTGARPTRTTVEHAPTRDDAPSGLEPVDVRAAADADADPDAEAVRRVLAGDVEAFGELVARWQGPLFRLALRYTSERATAEDLCQEIFLRAFRSLARWRGEARVSTWLVALATNVCRSHARRLPPPEPIELAGASDPAAPAAVGVAGSTGERVRRAVNALPARYRDALHLYYFHAMDVAAAAASLDLPVGTLKARLARGRKLLESLLGSRPD